MNFITYPLALELVSRGKFCARGNHLSPDAGELPKTFALRG
jgi:hypothetical protein